MRCGITVPNFGEYFSPALLAELAREAEESGWDGFFLWDHMQFLRTDPQPMNDPWIALAAVAAATSRIRLGPVVTPLARRRPWKVARETVTLDHLSNGRLILGVGLGHPPEDEFDRFGEDAADAVRAGKLDEGLEILAGLWTGEPFSFTGAHHRVRDAHFLPRPVQSPRIPVWVAGMWPNPGPFRRAARWDGVAPLKVGFPEQALTADDIRDIRAFVAGHRDPAAGPFDVVLGGWTPDRVAGGEMVAELAAAGATWWLESLDPWRGPLAAARARLRLGPPLVPPLGAG